MMVLKYLAFFLFLSLSQLGLSQNDSTHIRTIFDEALTNGHAYENLRELCKDVGHRLSGSEGADRAVEWATHKMKTYGFDRVWKQELLVPKWERGSPERCVLESTGDTLDILALGFSVGTDGKITAQVVEYPNLQALQQADTKELMGKIVFLNQPMNPRLIDTFHAYSGCAGGRSQGASIAAEKGAIAFVMRSLGLRADDYPHTGMMRYADESPKIPAFALSTNSAHRLSKSLHENPMLELSLEAHCQNHPDVLSHNVITEIRGSEFPDEVIVVGGHLDSWDVGEGAHDDGAGVVQSLEALRIFKELGIRPKRTIRCVFFMNEENGNRGGETYALYASESHEAHILALESDRGGFAPRGFSIDADKGFVTYFSKWLPLFEPYGVHFAKSGYGGVDIGPLKSQGTVLVGFVPDSQRYFDVHHSANDVFERVNQRELELGAATMASFIYLVDKYGLPQPIKP